MKIAAGKIKNQTTVIGNDFIDRFMPAANGEYVKIYLYLLRHASEEVTDDQIAQALELTSGDVHRALSYWNQAGLLETEQERTAEPQNPAAEKTSDVMKKQSALPEQTGLSKQSGSTEPTGLSEQNGLTKQTGLPEQNRLPEQSGLQELPASGPVIPEPAAKGDLVRLSEDQEFSEMLWIIEHYLQKQLDQKELASVVYLYDQLQLPRDLIEYLVEICVQKGKTSLKYIEAVARSWHQKGIRSIEDARRDTELYAAEIGCVMKIFGLNDRKPGEEELRYIDTWFRSYGFPQEVVARACSRTMAAIQKPSFRYADSILNKWYKEGVTGLKDIERLDREHEEKGRRSNAGRSSYGTKTDRSDVNEGRVSASTRINAIKREYDALQMRNREEAEARTREVYARIPELRELEEAITEATLAGARRSIATGEADAENAAKITAMKERKQRLLEENGFAQDYMQIRYSCPDCKDTGFINGKKCHCFIEKEKVL